MAPPGQADDGRLCAVKYMHSEWRDRLNHWLRTQRDDFYLRLGNIEVSAYRTMDQLSLEEALAERYEPIAPGTPWGRAWEYCWMRGRVVLPGAAAGKRIVMNLNTGGETTVFVDGQIGRAHV